MKFSDILIASTSANLDEISFWEPKTLAPYEPLIVKLQEVLVFIRTESSYLGQTLCVSAQVHM